MARHRRSGGEARVVDAATHLQDLATKALALLPSTPSPAQRSPPPSAPPPTSHTGDPLPSASFSPISQQRPPSGLTPSPPRLFSPITPKQKNTPLSASMSEKVNESNKGKGGPGSSSDIDTMLPLLFAAHPSWVPNYRRMAELDSYGRTWSSLEHKFRTWRKDGGIILANNPKIAEALKAGGETLKKRASATPKSKNGKGKKKQADVGGEDEVNEGIAITTVKQETEDMAGAESEMTPLASKDKVNATDGSKKRSISKGTDADDEESPAKKAKVTKKGTAQVVKKPAPKAREFEVTDDEDGSGDEEETKIKAEPKAKGKVKTAPKAKAATNGVKIFGSDQDPILQQTNRVAIGIKGVGKGEEEMTEMKFEVEI